jgi:hypothetical protein
MLIQILEEAMSHEDIQSWAELQSYAGYEVELTIDADVASIVLEGKDKKKVLAKIETPLEDGKTPEEKKKKIKATTVTDEEGLKDIEVNVIGSHYIYNHGKKPAGNGKWAFGVGSREPKDLLFFDGVYSQVSKQAVEAAKKKAKKEGKTAVKLYVMEATVPSMEYEYKISKIGKLVESKVIVDGKASVISGINEAAVQKKTEQLLEKIELDFLEERSLTKKETKTKEKVVKGIKKSAKDMKARYGKDWKSVAYGAATNIAKKSKLKEACDVDKEELEEAKERIFKLYFFDKDEPQDVKSVEVRAENRKDAMDYVYYKFGPVRIQRVQVLDEAENPEGVLIAEQVQTFEIEYEMQSEDGTSKGTTKYKALNAGEARTRFLKDNQGKKVTIRNVRPAKPGLNESAEVAMDVHDIAKLITKEAVKFANERLSQKQDDEFDRDTELEDGVNDYFDLVMHHLEDNRVELTSPEAIKSYLGEDYESGQYGSSKEEVIDNLIAKYLEGEDSEDIRTALSDAFEAGAELGVEQSEDIGSDGEEEPEEIVKEAGRSEYAANRALAKTARKIPTKEFSSFSEWKKFVLSFEPAIQFVKKAVAGGEIILAKDDDKVIGSYSTNNDFGFIGEDCEQRLQKKIMESSTVSVYAKLISQKNANM